MQRQKAGNAVEGASGQTESPKSARCNKELFKCNKKCKRALQGPPGPQRKRENAVNAQKPPPEEDRRAPELLRCLGIFKTTRKRIIKY